MNNYKKPIILANNELSEGVYAASGGTGCFSYNGYYGGDQSGIDGYYEYNVQFKHTADSHEGTHYIVVEFNSTPDSIQMSSTNFTLEKINGNSATFKGTQNRVNPNEGCAIGMKIKWAGAYGIPTGGYGYVG